MPQRSPCGDERMNTPDDFAVVVDLQKVWHAVETWDQKRAKSLQFPGCVAQLYMGAMEIPIVAFRPGKPVEPRADRVSAFASVLQRFGLALDCVEVGGNYKVNRSDTGEYVGRILPDALKLHAGRILDLGLEAFEEIVALYLGLPRA